MAPDRVEPRVACSRKSWLRYARSTGGGPANSTHLLATYAYQVGVATGLLGEGAAISLFMLPVLFVVVWLQLRYLRRLEGA